MNRLTTSVLALLALVSVACQDNQSLTPKPTTGVLLDETFANGQNGWEGEYTDYGVAQDSLIEFKFEYVKLPSPLDSTRKSLHVYGRNRSDDLFMFVRKKLTGLAPNTDYTLLFDVELASMYPENSVGIGGSPATSVFLKAGASALKPEKVKKDDFYNLSVDKGSQSDEGKNAVIIGNVANGKQEEGYALIQRSNKDKPLTVKTNEAGELWIFVGTDSGFEGDQSLYYSRVKVTAVGKE
ncbi:hypothetical protein [Rudanella lutea]|uniref:hypothetical protein n=1 Tax=Rudanella lutea TaxID=451374 RepID=UPI0003A19DA0|nr:hypothetical protein [Rudanella lutea]